MATHYFLSGDWHSASSWSATSGGSAGAAYPAPTDDVIFDANSGTGTLSAFPATINTVTSTAGTASLTFSKGLEVSSDIDAPNLTILTASGGKLTCLGDIDIGTSSSIDVFTGGSVDFILYEGGTGDLSLNHINAVTCTLADGYTQSAISQLFTIQSGKVVPGNNVSIGVLTQNAGEFDASSSTSLWIRRIDGNAGTFTAPSSTMKLQDVVDYETIFSDAPTWTFNHNNGTILLDGAKTSNFTMGPTRLNNLVAAMSGHNNDITGNLILDGSVTLNEPVKRITANYVVGGNITTELTIDQDGNGGFTLNGTNQVVDIKSSPIAEFDTTGATDVSVTSGLDVSNHLNLGATTTISANTVLSATRGVAGRTLSSASIIPDLTVKMRHIITVGECNVKNLTFIDSQLLIGTTSLIVGDKFIITGDFVSDYTYQDLFGTPEPEFHFVGTATQSVDNPPDRGYYPIRELVINKDAGHVYQKSDINSSIIELDAQKGVWCTNNFDLDVDTIDIDFFIADLRRTPASTITYNTLAGTILDVEDCSNDSCVPFIKLYDGDINKIEFIRYNGLLNLQNINSGTTRLIFKNEEATVVTITIHSVQDEIRRTGDVVITLQPGEIADTGFFPANLFNSNGKIKVDGDNVFSAVFFIHY